MNAQFDQGLIDAARVPGWKSRERLIGIGCERFLALAARGFDARKLADCQRLLAEGVPFNELPFLQIDRDGRVIGHEGRHRAMALLAAGITSMPCILRSCVIRWAHQDDPDRVDYIDCWPAAIVSESGALEYPFPVAQERAGEPYPL